MQMPQPSPRHDQLKRLAGTWRGTETMHPMAWSPQGGTADGVMECRMTCGGLFLVTDYTQLKDGKPGFTGHGIYGWDDDGQCFTMNWFDSMTPGGFANAVRGQWEGDTLTFTADGSQPARYVYRFTGDDELEFRIESKAKGGEWTCFMESRYRRA